MKTSLFILAAALFMPAVFFTGCSTPDSRIQKNPEAFDRLASAERELIRQGKVAIGFDETMVKLALGEPDRIISRTDAAGTSEIWAYTTYQTVDGYPLYRGWYHRHYGLYDPFFPYYLSYPARRDYDHLRVTFKNGKVSLIEQNRR